MTKKKPAVDLAAVRQARASLKKLADTYPELRGRAGPDNRARWEEELEKMTKKEVKDAQIVVRLPSALVDRVDAYAERLRDEQPGPAWTRSDVVRLLVARGLESVEPKRGKR